MAIQHSVITDPHIHEPKGASTAGAGTVYVSDGSGSGSWISLGTASLDWDAVRSEIQTDIDTGDLELTGVYYLSAVIPDVSDAYSVLFPVIENSTVLGASVVLGGAITSDDATISFLNSAGAGMGTPVTVLESGSGKGDQYNFTATGNNTITGPSWFEVATNGASTGSVPLFITVALQSILNP